MMRTMISTILFVLYFQVTAQKPSVIVEDKEGWQKLGETEASFKKQDESIHIFGNDRVSAIKLRVTDGTLDIDRLQVFYHNGKMQEIDVRDQIKENNDSKAFTLNYPNAEIGKVAFTYQTAANEDGDKAQITLLGQLTDDESSKAYRQGKDFDYSDRELKAKENETMEDTEETMENIDSVAERIGERISHKASKFAADVEDKRHPTKVGENGQTIYIDDDTMYYFVDRQGQKVYVSEVSLKEKNDQ